MSDKRIKIRYIASVDGRREVKRDHEHFFQYTPKDYSFITPEHPKINRACLFTPIAEKPKKRDAIFDFLKKYKERGHIEFMMVDSGGFQAGRFGISPEELVYEDLKIYSYNDWADIYIMPDMPPRGQDPLPIMEEMARKTMSLTHQLFDLLPSHIQERSAPVFHVRNFRHIDEQYDSYKDIINISKKCAFSIAAPTAKSYNKFDANNFELMSYTMDKVGQDVYMHCLGISSPLSVFCMAHIGLSSYDTISAKKSAGYGLILFPTGWYHFTSRRPPGSRRSNSSVPFEKIEELRETTGHRCPFCDDLDMFYRSTYHRRIHNFIVFDELNYHFRDMDLKHVHNYDASQSTKGPLVKLLDNRQLYF